MIIITIFKKNHRYNNYKIQFYWGYSCYLYLSPDNVWMTSPLSVSQILTVLSPDPDTTFLPSADNATELTESL